MKKNIANIIMFQRGIGSPDLHSEKSMDRFAVCTVKQIDFAKKYNIPVTWLLDYIAVCDTRFKESIEQLEKFEIGGWLEFSKPLVEKAGYKWRGREGHIWEYHCNHAFTVGYTVEQREKMIDVFMQDFKEIFGYYPKSVGAWIIDAYSLNYMHEKYGIEASCICRDQWGTDGITLWGGYYGQGYYPSKNNILSPAQTKENQINVPVFRMLGSCPIYQYDNGLNIDDGPCAWQQVCTLEPSYFGEDCAECGGGGFPEWVDWFFHQNYREDTLSFNYAHIGQENYFGWKKQESGTIDQVEKLIKMSNEGKVSLQLLSETGRDYKNQYNLTPATSISAEKDWKDKDLQSFWYNCKNYRLNLYKENGTFWFRDMFLFDENYFERYRHEICPSKDVYFDNLPIIDGNRHSGKGVRAGIYPMIQQSDGTHKSLQGVSKVKYSYPNETITIKDDDTSFIINITEKTLSISCNKDFKLCIKTSSDVDNFYFHHNILSKSYNGYEYSIKLNNGIFSSEANEILSSNKKITIGLK